MIKLEEHFDEEVALSELLIANEVFANSRKYWCDWKKELQPETIVLFVNCNDTFYWACADCESIKLDEVKELYTMWKKDPIWGTTKWVCKKRNMQPQPKLIKRMKDQNVWCSLMQNLPVREYLKV